MLGQYCVYSHSLNGQIFYIGKGSQQRAYSKHCRNELWNGLVGNGGFEVSIIKRFRCTLKARRLERALIRKMKPSANICDNPDNAEMLWEKVFSCRIRMRNELWRLQGLLSASPAVEYASEKPAGRKRA